MILFRKTKNFFSDVHMIFTRPPKEKIITSEYVPLEAIQFLSEIFFITNNNNHINQSDNIR